MTSSIVTLLLLSTLAAAADVTFPLLPLFPTIFAPDSPAVSNALCRNDSALFLQSLKNASIWALEMFDSSTKFPTGFFVGSITDLGNFDECLSVQVKIQDDENSSERSIKGKYCLATLVIPPSKLPAPTNEARTKIQNSVKKQSELSLNAIQWAICIPSSCSAFDLKAHLDHVFPKLDGLKPFGVPIDDVEVFINEKSCSTDEDNSDLTIGQAVFLTFMIILVILMILGTVIDHIIRRTTMVSKGCIMEVLLCFSFKRNLKKLLGGYQSNAVLGPISAAKFISMALLIFGHRNLTTAIGPLQNPKFYTERYDSVDYSFIMDGMIIVDTFYLITGFLLCYNAVSYAGRLTNAWMIFYLYFRRYIRLTPVYILLVAFTATLYIKLGSGPMWNTIISLESDKCVENWWVNALYLNNFINVDRMCFKASWYLATDMQLFIISVPTVYLLINRPSLGKIILGILLVASVGIPFIVVYHNQLEPIVLGYIKNIVELSNYKTFNYVYIPSYMRGTPYFLGILAGYFTHHFQKSDMKLSQMQANFIMVGAFILGLLPILVSTFFFQEDYKYNALESAAHASLQRVSWGLAMWGGLTVFAAGREWYIMKFLSWKVFGPLSKLSYSAYLLHIFIHIYGLGSMRSPHHASWFYIIHSSVSDCVLTLLLAFVMSMLVEAPWINLERLIFNDGPSTENKEKSHDDQHNQTGNTECTRKECEQAEEKALREQDE